MRIFSRFLTREKPLIITRYFLKSSSGQFSGKNMLNKMSLAFFSSDSVSSCAVCGKVSISSSMKETALALCFSGPSGDQHGQISLVGFVDHLLVSHRPEGIDNRSYLISCCKLDNIRERHERIGSHDAASGSVATL